MKTNVIASALVGLAACAAATGALATTIPLSLTVNYGGAAASYNTEDLTFTLPAGFTGATLNTTSFYSDDRAVAELNGAVVSSTGIYGPGNGSFYFTNGGPIVPFTFQYGNAGPFAPITSGFVAGLNTLHLIVNNTGNGIYGGPTGGPSSVGFDGTVSYSVPEPATWALMLTGFGLAGLVIRRRRVATVEA